MVGRTLITAAMALALTCCVDVQVIGADGFADQLEETGLAGIPISDVSCTDGPHG